MGKEQKERFKPLPKGEGRVIDTKKETVISPKQVDKIKRISDQARKKS